LLVIQDFGWVIPLGIGSFGYDEIVLGAELNTKTAPFTTVIDDMHDTASNLDAITV